MGLAEPIEPIQLPPCSARVQFVWQRDCGAWWWLQVKVAAAEIALCLVHGQGGGFTVGAGV